MSRSRFQSTALWPQWQFTPQHNRRFSLRPLFLWIVAGVLLAADLGHVPVTRSQEARVLETAREMLGAPFDDWMIPRLNGHPRMQKPPLSYWLTAGSYKLFGVGEKAGRLPAVLAAWLTVGLAACVASTLFGPRAGFFAAAALLGNVLFFRHARLAETDVLATLFVTAGCWAMWRGFDGTSGGCNVRRRSAAPWYHAAAAAMALAALAKGPPAGYPLLFLFGLCVVERRWRPALCFVTTGAPLTFAAIALPWFAYVATNPTARALVADLRNSVEGGKGHWDLPTTYVQVLALGVAPWTAIFTVAVVAAAGRWRRNACVRRLLVWALMIVVPLTLWGNKQRHYLLPLLPPLMIVLGWFVDRALHVLRRRPAARSAAALRGAAFVSAGLCLLFAFFVPVPAYLVRGRVLGIDHALAAAAAAAVLACLVAYRRRGLTAGLVCFAFANVLIIFAGVVLWQPTLKHSDVRGIARKIAERYGDAPLAFVRREHLPLCFNLRRIIPLARTEPELIELLHHNAGLVGIDVLAASQSPTTAALREEIRFTADEELIVIVGPIREVDVVPRAAVARLIASNIVGPACGESEQEAAAIFCRQGAE